MRTLALLLALALGACAQTDCEIAPVASHQDECAKFNDLRKRAKEQVGLMTTEQLERLLVVNRLVKRSCSVSITELTIEVEEMLNVSSSL
ncbi:MAG: hypothetical protein ACR2RE_14680 [Geminicoccaceae bacterium]